MNMNNRKYKVKLVRQYRKYLVSANEVNTCVFIDTSLSSGHNAALYTLAPAYNTRRAHFGKHALVMRNANSDVDIYSATTNTDTRYLSTSPANGRSYYLLL